MACQQRERCAILLKTFVVWKKKGVYVWLGNGKTHLLGKQHSSSFVDSYEKLFNKILQFIGSIKLNMRIRAKQFNQSINQSINQSGAFSEPRPLYYILLNVQQGCLLAVVYLLKTVEICGPFLES